MTNKIYNYARQYIDEDDIAAVVETLKSDWLTTGPTTNRFEKEFSKKVNARYAVSCSSGTAALHLAYLALGLNSDSYVVVPDITFLSTANAARFVGAEVLFSDVDENTGLMTPENLSRVLSDNYGKSIKAVAPVHLNGQTVDMESIRKITDDNNIYVIEDASHALGAKYLTGNEVKAQVGDCQFSDLTIFSMHAIKMITMGEGGVITTNDEEIYKKLLLFRNHGINRNSELFLNEENGIDKNGNINPWYYEMIELGYNYRASDIQCSLGLSQLDKLDKFVEKKQELVEWYDKKFESIQHVLPIKKNKDLRPGWHLYPVKISFNLLNISKVELMTELREKGILTQVHYIPLHYQPYYKSRYGKMAFIGAENYYNAVLSLPLSFDLEKSDIDHISDVLIDILKNNEK